MRDSFARRGIVLSSSAMSTALARSVEHAPRDLAGRAANKALSADAAVGGMNLLAWRIFGSMSFRFAAGIGGAILLLTILLMVLIAQNSHAHYAAGSNIVSSRPIKVGVLLSEFSAAGWHGTGPTWNLRHQKTIASLGSPKLDLYVIYEPGPQKLMAYAEARYVAPNHMLNGADRNALRKLDVIVAGHNWHMRQEVLDAIMTAVREDGVGLLEQAGFGMFTPSFTPQVCTLSGIANDGVATYLFHEKEAVSRVVATHPVLKGLKVGDELHVAAACGALAHINGTPLVAAYGIAGDTDVMETERMEYIAKVTKRPAFVPVSADSFEKGPVFCPLYISPLGKGWIIACQWHNAPPVELDPKFDGTFYVRCIEWLAGRAVE